MLGGRRWQLIDKATGGRIDTSRGDRTGGHESGQTQSEGMLVVRDNGRALVQRLVKL